MSSKLNVLHSVHYSGEFSRVFESIGRLIDTKLSDCFMLILLTTNCGGEEFFCVCTITEHLNMY